MSLSPKAQAAADSIKSFSDEEKSSFADMIRHEVQHATDIVTDRARKAEQRLRQFTDHAGDDLGHIRDRATRTINDHPVPSTMVALGVGFILGALLISGRR